jgi:NDP-sugar pyrophosphorylase family protein
MKAMVLAAGKGTRLFPLTGVLPKPMAPVAGKPVLQHIFDLLARASVEEIHVNVHYLANTILGLYGEETRVDGAKVHFTREEQLTGTAGGVKRLASVGAFDETFVVIMGDALTDVDMRELVAFHGRVTVEVPGEWCGGGLWISEEARVHPSAYSLMESYTFVGSNAVVGRGASLSGAVAVRSDCRVSDGSIVKQSVLLPGSSVGSGAYLEDCIVGPGYAVRPGEWIRGGALVRGAS